MIQQTVRRIRPMLPPKNVFIVTTREQVEDTKSQLPEIPTENFIVEPYGKNTAPCIGLGCLYIRRRDPNALVIVLPADHMITDEKRFEERLRQAASVAQETESLVTIGIQPTYPATGYGYIQHTDERIEASGGWAYRVKTFAEKPNYETACRFVESGEFLWNSGIFVWKISTIMRELDEYLPDIADSLHVIDRAIGTNDEQNVIDTVYRQFKSVSIDYGVMERAKNVAIVPGDFGWNDLGSWDEVYKICDKDTHGNAAAPTHVLLDTKNCFIDGQGRVIATIGLQDLIIVDTEDALLICPRSRAQEVKEIVEQLKRRKLDRLI